MARRVSHHGLVGFLVGLGPNRKRRREFLAELVPENDGALGLPLGHHNGVGHARLVLAEILEQLLHGNHDLPDLGFAEGADGDELDLEFEAVLLESGVVEREFEGVVPLGVGAAVLVDRGPELVLLGGAGDRNDGVDVHLGEEVDVLDVIGGEERHFQGPAIHFLIERFLGMRDEIQSTNCFCYCGEKDGGFGVISIVVTACGTKKKQGKGRRSFLGVWNYNCALATRALPSEHSKLWRFGGLVGFPTTLEAAWCRM